MGVLINSELPPPANYSRKAEYVCRNRNCNENYFDLNFYYMNRFEEPPDRLYCPNCGSPLENSGLWLAYARSTQAIVACPGESVSQYRLSFDHLAMLQRVIKASIDKKWQNYEVAGLDVILRTAPVIFDEQGLFTAQEMIRIYNLKHYEKVVFSDKYQALQQIKTFFDTLPMNLSIKQVEIKNEFDKLPISDTFYKNLGWITYVWANFGFITRETIKNRVYFTRVEHQNCLVKDISKLILQER